MTFKEVFFLFIVLAIKAFIFGGFILSCFYIYDKYLRKYVIKDKTKEES